MSESANYCLYFLVVLSVIVLPGMDMAFVMSSSMTSGRRVGLAAVAGIVAGGVCHMLITATGISVLLKMMPAAMMLMLLIGSLYIAWIGCHLIRVSSLTGPALGKGARTSLQSFFGAMATCLLNPKAYIFMLAIFPQFVHAERGSVWAQASVLSLITAATQIAIYGALALLAAQTQTLLAARPQANAWLAKCVGLILIMAAAFTLLSGLMGLR